MMYEPVFSADRSDLLCGPSVFSPALAQWRLVPSQNSLGEIDWFAGQLKIDKNKDQYHVFDSTEDSKRECKLLGIKIYNAMTNC